MKIHHRAFGTPVPALMILLAIAGCANRATAPKPAPRDVPPAPTSPTNVVRAVEWSFNHRDTTTYETLFSADYRFFFAAVDSGWIVYVDHLDVGQEWRFGRSFFDTGCALEPPPVSISLTFDPNLTALPDSRPGMNASVHREIPAALLLRVHQPDFEVTGVARFFAVRGDSAIWPAGLAHPAADSTRWFIQQWDDETTTLHGPGLHTLPTRSWSMGTLKDLYLR